MSISTPLTQAGRPLTAADTAKLLELAYARSTDTTGPSWHGPARIVWLGLRTSAAPVDSLPVCPVRTRDDEIPNAELASQITSVRVRQVPDRGEEATLRLLETCDGRRGLFGRVMRAETDLTFFRGDSTWQQGGFNRTSSASYPVVGLAITFALALGYAWLLVRAREGLRRARIASWLAPIALAAVVACVAWLAPDDPWYIDKRPGAALKELTWSTIYLLVVVLVAAPLSYLFLRMAERLGKTRRARWAAATIGVLAGGLLGLYVATIGAFIMAGPNH